MAQSLSSGVRRLLICRGEQRRPEARATLSARDCSPGIGAAQGLLRDLVRDNMGVARMGKVGHKNGVVVVVR